MSMVLYCKEMELLPTPMHITYMCYFKINKSGKRIADNWQSILYRYIEWIKSSIDIMYFSNKEFKLRKKLIDNHIEKLKSFKQLSFRIR